MPRTLVVNAAGVDKVYDGNTDATVTLSDNRVAGDTLSESYTTASFTNPNAGPANAVSVSGIALTGDDAANYTHNTTATTQASITPRALVVIATGMDKVYDGTADATVTLSDNRLAGDALSEGYTTASFANRNAGPAKAVSVSGITLSGDDAGNYTHNPTATTQASITARGLTVTAVSDTKLYDGTTGSTGSPTLGGAGLVSGDSAAFTQSFDNKNVGTAKTLTPAGTVTDGNAGLNYNVSLASVTTGQITPVGLTVKANNLIKGYGATVPAHRARSGATHAEVRNQDGLLLFDTRLATSQGKGAPDGSRARRWGDLRMRG